MNKVVFLSLACACAPKAVSDTGVYFEPKPFAETAPNEWGTVAEGLPPREGFSIVDLASLDGDVYVVGGRYKSDVGGLFALDRATGAWTRLTTNEGAGSLIAGPDGKLYNANGQEFRRYTKGAAAWEALASAPRGIEMLAGNKIGMPNTLVSVNEDWRVMAYDIGTNTWQDYAPPSGDLDPTKLSRASSAAADRSGALYVGTAWSVRDSKGALGATYRFRRGATSWQDATFNLRDTNEAGLPKHLLNMTGNGWGPFGAVAAGPGEGGDVYATTEQGVFRLPGESDRWEQINAYWGTARLSSSPGYLFAAQDRVDLYESATRRRPLGQQKLFGCERQSFTKLTAPDASLVVARVAVERCAEGKPDADFLVALRIDPGSPVIDRNLTLDYAGYFGSDGQDEAVAAEWSKDALFAAMNVNGAGIIVKTDNSGKSLGSRTLPWAATDMALNETMLVVSSRTAVIAYSLDFTAELFRFAFDDTDSRVAIAADGTIAVVAGKRVLVLSPQGALVAETTLQRAYVTDVAVDHDTVYVTGYDNQRLGEPVQIPFLLAHARGDLVQRWKAWGFDPKTVGDDMADSRLYRVTLSKDGGVYVLGELAGGNTVFRWNGQDLKTPTLVSFDNYNQATNTRSEHKLYYARVNRETGVVERGQLAIPRLPDGGGNTFRAGSLAVDELGRVFVGGTSAYAMAARDLNLVNGQLVSPYAGGDMAVLIVNPDFSTRLRWTTLSKNAGSGRVAAIAASNGRTAALTTATKGELFVTDGSQPRNPGDDELDDVHLAIWRE